MAPLNTDSLISRRIVRSFLQFLNSVEPAPDVNLEGIEIARECLEEAFNINTPHPDDGVEPDSLVDIFWSIANKNNPVNGGGSTSVSAPSSSAAADTILAEASTSLGEESTSTDQAIGDSKDALFGQFFSALEKTVFLRTLSDGREDPVRVDKATQLFHDALNEMDKSGCKEYSPKNLAETLKLLGNKAMQSKLFPKAIELYDCAIALRETNAVYRCNRAAAYTQIHQYDLAVRDCLKSIEIDPNYSKAYSRLGLAYYGMGNYREAIDKGFKKALQLDPNNEAIKENIRVAHMKLRQQHHPQGETRMHTRSYIVNAGGDSLFESRPSLSSDFENMFRNMTSNASEGQHSQDREGDDPSRNINGSDEPQVRVEPNINVNFGDMPEELSGALRSMMHMFSGAPSPGNSQDTPNAGPRPN